MLVSPTLTLGQHHVDFSVLVIEDNFDDFYLVRQMLAKDLRKTYELLHAQSLEEAQLTLEHAKPDLILLDLGLEQTQGLQTLTALQEQSTDLPVIVFTGVDDEDLGEQAIKMGAEDYLPKAQANSAILSRAISYAVERHSLLTKIQQQAWVDTLTGLANRPALFQYLTTQINNSNRNKQSITVVMIDLDGFKAINDKFGHQAGDDVLITIANRLEEHKRVNDFVARLGGDEFIWVLIGCEPKEKTLDLIEHKLKLINHDIPLELDLHQSITARVGASIGVAMWESENNPQALINRADKAMYQSKHHGKNQIHFAE
ncbi:hypothetical protein PULV_a1088 [Pseudoalteromonas ulvae UL12]|uniref:diguanylate cyclase n=1 Tax=Pseudoalteromonas ulvae TaxID=107327 RepID=A0A244CS98_PSEDV|nr:diguanylate cyclase [Pseudoalteromonas ulvae]MBE0363619.1 hypothetical protein [Pseudoalteromonas ulvae UL12]OUL58474.1 hypothetical protein B1199_09100 [Pseudoalteromonas ulvae]